MTETVWYSWCDGDYGKADVTRLCGIAGVTETILVRLMWRRLCGIAGVTETVWYIWYDGDIYIRQILCGISGVTEIVIHLHDGDCVVYLVRRRLTLLLSL